MVALSITAANVKWVSGPKPRMVMAGAAIDRGEALYQDEADLEHKLASNSAEATAEAVGVALTDGEDGSHMLIAKSGTKINIGATTVAGTIYCVGDTAGSIVPQADVTNEDYVTILFVGTGSAEVTLDIVVGAAIPAA